MSRTVRRNKKHLIHSFCGAPDTVQKDPWWVLMRYRDLTPEKAYARNVARYTRDHPSGRFNVPNWYRREHGVFRLRRREKQAIHRHMRADCWESHLPDNRMCESMYQFWW